MVPQIRKEKEKREKKSVSENLFDNAENRRHQSTAKLA
jgi:hypothetical protein